jgi:hypothetical protein
MKVPAILPFAAAVMVAISLCVHAEVPRPHILHIVAHDPEESTNLASKYPDKVKALETRLEKLAQESAKPLFMETAMDALFSGIFGPAPIPTEENSATGEP